MLHNNVERPPRLYGAADQQLQQVYRYLYTLSEQVQNVFDSIEMDDETAKRLKELQDKIAAVERDVGLKPGKKAFAQVEEVIGKQTADLSLLGQNVNILGQNVNILGQNMVTVQAGVGDNAARLTLAEGKITANANAILLKADQASLELAEGKIVANANAIALKADQASLDLVDGKITAQAEEILLKADKIDLQGYVTAAHLAANYAKVADLNAITAQITNLTGGLVTAAVLRSTLFTGNQANFTFLTADVFNLGNELVQKKTISMGDVSSTGKALGIGDLKLDHSHEVTVSADGKLQMGKATETGSTFDLAATQFYKNGVAAATTKGAESLVFYAGGKEGVADLDYGTSLSITATTTRADGTALAKGILVKAPPDNYNTGWNECIQNANAFSVLINYYSAGETLYDRDGNVAAGPWYKGTPATRYSLPASKT